MLGTSAYRRRGIHMKNYLNEIAVLGNDNRRLAIEKILKDNNINYQIVGNNTKNIVTNNLIIDIIIF